MKYAIVDAFTATLFKGNPAAVCFVDNWPVEQVMQQIACENRLSETAFARQLTPTHYQLRWFTPGGEIDLCGHATLATGYLVFRFRAPGQTQITFTTQSGDLVVTKQQNWYAMQFPSYALQPTPVTPAMTAALGVTPQAAYLGRDLLCVLEDEQLVRNLAPDQARLEKLPGLLQHVTAAGQDYDCVSRSFGPKLAVPEDPVCGSGHCHIVPYWAQRLHRNQISAYQASARGGELRCALQGQHVQLCGQAVLYAQGTLTL